MSDPIANPEINEPTWFTHTEDRFNPDLFGAAEEGIDESPLEAVQNLDGASKLLGEQAVAPETSIGHENGTGVSEIVPLSRPQRTWLNKVTDGDDQVIDKFENFPADERLRIIGDIGVIYVGLKVKGLYEHNKKLRVKQLQALFEGQNYTEIGQKTGHNKSDIYKGLSKMAITLKREVNQDGLIGLVGSGQIDPSLMEVSSDAGENDEPQPAEVELSKMQKGWYTKLFGEEFVDLEFLSRLSEQQKEYLIGLVEYQLEMCFRQEDPLRVDRRQKEVALIIQGKTIEDISEEVRLDLGVLVKEVYQSVAKLHDTISPLDLADMVANLKEL